MSKKLVIIGYGSAGRRFINYQRNILKFWNTHSYKAKIGFL